MFENAPANFLDLIHHIQIIESQNLIPNCHEGSIALCVLGHAMPVLTAVDLDNEQALHTDEIDGVAIDWPLTPELMARQSPIAQLIPQQSFCNTGCPAEASSATC